MRGQEETMKSGHVIGKCNSNGELLLALCSESELIVTNTMFKQKDEREVSE